MNTQTLTLLQVTDPHITATNDLHKNINSRQQCYDVLQVLKQQSADLLILSGDLAANYGEIEAYQWLQTQLQDLPYPYVVMVGNHDKVETMVNAFQLSQDDVLNDKLCFKRQIKGKTLLFLDSAANIVTNNQLDWLQQQLVEAKEEVLLFIHHPPTLCDCIFMDTHYPLLNHDVVWKTLRQSNKIKHIFCGHYHTDKLVQKAGKSIHITPSTMYQIDTTQPKFNIEHQIPGWRVIECRENSIHTYTKYLTKY